MTLVELSLSMTILVVAVGLTVAMVSSMTSLSDSARERIVAYQAAQRILEDLRELPASEVFARYNGTTADDPATGASPGPHIAVPELSARPDDSDGLVAEIVLPEDPSKLGQLREKWTDASLGMPRDLDLDGNMSNNDIADSYRVLPVIVRLEWLGRTGSRTIELGTLLFE